MKLFADARASLGALALASLIAACAEHSGGSTAPADDVAFAKVVEGTGTIQIIQGGTGGGTVISKPAGIDCTITPGSGATGTCEATFPAGTKVRLIADAAEGSTFEGWAPVTSCFKAPHVVVEADRVHSCQPVFDREPGSQFFISMTPTGSGQVTSSPAGIDCTSDADAGTITGTCAAVYDVGTVITFTATPLAGWMFVAWGGDDPDCNDGVVTLRAVTRCTATFARAGD